MNDKQIKRDKAKTNNNMAKRRRKKVYAIENGKTTRTGGIELKLTKANSFRYIYRCSN